MNMSVCEKRARDVFLGCAGYARHHTLENLLKKKGRAHVRAPPPQTNIYIYRHEYVRLRIARL